MSNEQITAQQFADQKGMSRLGRLAFFQKAGVSAETQATTEEFEAMLEALRLKRDA